MWVSQLSLEENIWWTKRSARGSAFFGHFKKQSSVLKGKYSIPPNLSIGAWLSTINQLVQATTTTTRRRMTWLLTWPCRACKYCSQKSSAIAHLLLPRWRPTTIRIHTKHDRRVSLTKRTTIVALLNDKLITILQVVATATTVRCCVKAHPRNDKGNRNQMIMYDPDPPLLLLLPSSGPLHWFLLYYKVLPLLFKLRELFQLTLSALLIWHYPMTIAI